MDLGGVVKRIEHFEIALAGDAEGHLDPMRPQRGDDQLAAAERCKICRHDPTSTVRIAISHLRR